MNKITEKLFEYAKEPFLGKFLKDLYTFVKNKLFGAEEVQKLRLTVLRVKALLNNAEQRGIVEDEGVLQRLRDCRAIVLDAEDVLEEFCARKEASRVPSTRKRKRFSFSFEVASLVEEIQKRYKKIDSLRCARPKLTWTKKSCPAEETSLNGPSMLYGREKEMNRVVDALKLRDHYHLIVIAIEGFGGSGKTALAKSVYAIRNEELKFDYKIWIDMSDGGFDVHSVTRKIIEQVPGNKECGLTTLNSLQECLQGLLRGKRFLLVLDDVAGTSFDRSEKLLRPLMQNDKGSRILVTTRNAHVSMDMLAWPRITLGLLWEEACWDLFKDRAFVEGEKRIPLLEQSGMKIVKNLGGSPLLVKTICSFLYGVIDETEWHQFRDSMLQMEANNALLALKVCYDQLPSHLRRCLEICSIFPKGHVFDKDEVVRLWMALDLVERTNNNGRVKLEHVGRKYFDELLWRSFFQLYDSKDPNHKQYQMPSLIHELAQKVSEHVCFTTVGSDLHGDAPKSRYAFYKEPKTFEKIGEHECLRALFLHGQDKDKTNLEKVLCKSWNKMQYLRVLDMRCNQFKELQDWILELTLLRFLALRGSQIEQLPGSIGGLLKLETLDLNGCKKLMGLPESIGNLRNLRYLGLGQTAMTILPESFCNITGLQSLDLRGCSGFSRLPNDIGKLEALTNLNLNHTCIKRLPESVSKLSKLSVLDLSECYELEELPRGLCRLTSLRNLNLHLDWEKWDRTKKFHSMPPEIGRLESLQTLSRFSVGTEYHCGIDQLKNLSSIEGELCISKLENVDNIYEVQSANISGKSGIKLMILQWSSDVAKVNPQIVIEQLRPPTNVRHLWIENYNGVSLPSWISDTSFKSLETLRLSDCKRCHHFSQLGELPALKSLHIKGLDQIKGIGLSSVRSGHAQQRFSSLQTFVLSHMSKLSKVKMSGMIRLVELSITDCPNLKEVSHLPSKLERFELRNCKALHAFVQSSLLSLQDLTVEKCNGAILKWIEDITSLSSLTISELEVEALDDRSFRGLKDLRTLAMSRMPKLSNVEMSGMANLLELFITDCPKLKEVSHLPSTLKRFELRNCTSLDVFKQSPSPSLQDLTVEKCSSAIFRWIEELTSLSSLTISQVELVELGSQNCGGLKHLKSLKIESCDHLKTLTANWLQRLTCLECLEIYSCSQFSFANGNALPAALKEFRMKSCEKVKNMPELPTGLWHLTVKGCPGLQKYGAPFYKFWRKRKWDQMNDIEEIDVD